MTRHASAALLVVAALAAIGCGEKRRYGDDDGVPVAFSVELERGFVADMRNNQGRVGVGAGAGFSSGGSTTVGTGVGVSFSPTEVYLLGGEQSGGAQLFRKELSWGENAFTVPLRAGRSLTLTVQAQGGRQGWETIGTLVVPSATSASARITLLGSGPTIAVEPTGAAKEGPAAKPDATTAKPDAAPAEAAKPDAR